MSKYTKGQWCLDKHMDSRLIHIRAPGKPPIATIRWSDNPNLSPEEAEANANLMVNSPELFDVCCLAESFFNAFLTTKVSVEQAKAQMRRLREVIKKVNNG